MAVKESNELDRTGVECNGSKGGEWYGREWMTSDRIGSRGYESPGINWSRPSGKEGWPKGCPFLSFFSAGTRVVVTVVGCGNKKSSQLYGWCLVVKLRYIPEWVFVLREPHNSAAPPPAAGLDSGLSVHL